MVCLGISHDTEEAERKFQPVFSSRLLPPLPWGRTLNILLKLTLAITVRSSRLMENPQIWVGTDDHRCRGMVSLAGGREKVRLFPATLGRSIFKSPDAILCDDFPDEQVFDQTVKMGRFARSRAI